MRTLYCITTLLSFVALMIYPFITKSSLLICTALILWVFALKPLIDYLFIKKRHLSNEENPLKYYPFFWKYRFDLLLKK